MNTFKADKTHKKNNNKIKTEVPLLSTQNINLYYIITLHRSAKLLQHCNRKASVILRQCWNIKMLYKSNKS